MSKDFAVALAILLAIWFALLFVYGKPLLAVVPFFIGLGVAYFIFQLLPEHLQPRRRKLF